MAPSLAPYKMGIQEVETTESEVQVIFGTSLEVASQSGLHKKQPPTPDSNESNQFRE